MTDGPFTESIEITELDEKEIIEMYSEPDGGEDREPPPFHTILEVWRSVLEPAKTEAEKKVTPQWATRMISLYPNIEYREMTEFRDRYFGKLSDLNDILLAEIATDDECLNQTTAAEDVEHNSEHYRNLLLSWQLCFLSWELEWDCSDKHAAVELGAQAEVHKMFFSPTGLLGLLEQIQFEYTEADQVALVEALTALQDEAGEK